MHVDIHHIPIFVATLLRAIAVADKINVLVESVWCIKCARVAMIALH